jgi:hypothetical protein
MANMVLLVASILALSSLISDGTIKPPSNNPTDDGGGINDGTGREVDGRGAFWGDVQAFSNAINWSSDGYWIYPVLILHVLTFLLILRYRASTNTTIVIFLILSAAVKSCEYVNPVLSSNHGTFSSQDYFDPNGVFISIFMAGPCLLNCVVCVLGMVAEAKNLLVEVKTREFKEVR